MDDRNVALSEQALINPPGTTDYNENTMVDVEVMSEKPASLSETWHSTSSTTPPSAATAQPVDNYTTGEGDYTSGGVCAAKNTKTILIDQADARVSKGPIIAKIPLKTPTIYPFQEP